MLYLTMNTIRTAMNIINSYQRQLAITNNQWLIIPSAHNNQYLITSNNQYS